MSDGTSTLTGILSFLWFILVLSRFLPRVSTGSDSLLKLALVHILLFALGALIIGVLVQVVIATV